MSGKRTPQRLVAKRKKQNLQTRTKVYLVLEGEVTEKQYFIAVGKTNPKGNYEMIPVTPGSSRTTLFDKAADLLEDLKREAKKLGRNRRHSDVGEIWIVCDVDDEGRVLSQLLERRESKEVRWIISNPSFDVWIGMHFQRITAYIDRQEIQSQLKERKVLTGPNAKTISMDQLQGLYSIARDNAQACAKRHEGVTTFPDNNPSSQVPELVDRLNPEWR